MSKKLALKEVLGAIDLGGRTLWDELSEEERKGVSFYILNRMCSFVNGNREKQELAVFKTNEYFNKHFYDIGTSKIRDHRKLLWHLLCMCGDTDKAEYHPWVKLNVKLQSNDRTKLIQELRPDLGTDEVNLLAAISTNQELIELAKEHGIEEPKLR